MSIYPSRRLRAGLAGLAALIAGSAIAPAVFAETGAPRTDAVISILSDSTSPDNPADGQIPTFDLASYRLNVSQNGADATADVVSTVTLVNGKFIDSSPTEAGINPPKVCGTGSSISADSKTLVCNLGKLTQGTSVAIDYSVQASGEVANGDELTGTISTPGAPTLQQPPLTITGTSQVDVAKTFVSATNGETAAGTPGKFYRYRLDVRTTDASGKGGLPLDSVSFTDDWSDLKAQLPGAVLVTQSDPYNPGQVLPVGLNSTSPVRAVADDDTTAGQNSPEWIIPNPGTWTATYANNADTSVGITVAGFSNESIAARQPASTVVSSGLITFFVPESSAPIGTTDFVNRITNITAVPKGGGAAVGDYDATNNQAEGSYFRVIPGAYRNASSAWIDSGTGIAGDMGNPAIEGNYSDYLRPAFSPANWSSGGQQQSYRGQLVKAEAVNLTAPARFTGGVTSQLTCVKFQQPVTGAGGAATADIVGLKLFGGPSAKHLTHGTITIQYATIASPSAADKCDDAAGSWTSTRPASFNAVRAYGAVRAAGVNTAEAEGRGIALVLQVPVTTPASATIGSTRGFWNTAVNGSFGAGDPINSTTVSSDGVDGGWLGTGTSAVGGDDTYNVTANTGDSRFGDRLFVAQAVSTFDKSVCDTDGSTQEVAVGDTVDYCLTAKVEGSGTVNGVKVIDTSIAQPGSPLAYVPGSATVQIGTGTATATEPTLDASNNLVWNIGNVTAPDTVKVRFTARASSQVANPGESFTNTAHIESPDLPDYSGKSTDQDPNADAQAIQFRSGRFELNITKSTSSPSVTYPNTPVNWDLNLANKGESTIGTVELIDILPFNGDASQDRTPASAFTGTVGLTAAVTAGPNATVTYTTAAPASISSNPQDPSNQPGGATTWSATPPADLKTVTAVRIVDTDDLLAGDIRTITVPMAADANKAGDKYTNDTGAVVQEGAQGPILPIRSNDVTVTVQSPGLSIVKTTEDKTFYAGVENTYTLTVKNDGGIAEPNAVVTDVLQPGLTPKTISDGGVFDITTRTITWPGKAVAAGASFTYTVTVTVDSPINPGLVDDSTGVIPNTAKVTGAEDCKPTGTQNERCESTVDNPPGNPQIAQDKVVDLSKALPGNELTYTVTASNIGDAPATKVVALDELPPNVTYKSSDPEKGDVVDNGDGTLTWNIGDLAVDEEVHLTVVATINKGEWDKHFINKVKVSHDPGDCTSDECPAPVVEHKCEDDPTKSCAPTETPSASIRQDKVVDKAKANPGDTLTYTLRLTNEGAVAGTPAKAVDELPPGVTYVAGSASNGGVYDAATRTITWTELPELAPGKVLDLTVKATIDAGQYNASFINKFQVTPPPDFPPTNVDHKCEDDPTKSCAPTVTPGTPGKASSGNTGQGGNSALPVTGATVIPLGLLALALIAGGVLIIRRKRTEDGIEGAA